VIVPTTWFSNGAGVVGNFGAGLALKTFVMSSLDATGFSAEEGFREGRQKGFFDDFEDPALVARLEYSGAPNLVLGGTYWTGETGFALQPLDIAARASIVELDAMYRGGRFDLRGEWARTHLDDAARLNLALRQTTGIDPNLAEEMRGYYVEGAFHLFSPGARHDLVAFYRFEDFDTQYRMPRGYLPLEQFDREAHVFGFTYLPHPDIAIKIDYSVLDNESAVVEATDRYNLGLGWWF
jgi:hypothetical protein